LKLSKLLTKLTYLRSDRNQILFESRKIENDLDISIFKESVTQPRELQDANLKKKYFESIMLAKSMGKLIEESY
jgi:hypothetical protein